MWLKDADAAKQAMIKNGFKLIRFFRVKDEEEKVEYCFAYKVFPLISFLCTKGKCCIKLFFYSDNRDV